MLNCRFVVHNVTYNSTIFIKDTKTEPYNQIQNRLTQDLPPITQLVMAPKPESLIDEFDKFGQRRNLPSPTKERVKRPYRKNQSQLPKKKNKSAKPRKGCPCTICTIALKKTGLQCKNDNQYHVCPKPGCGKDRFTKYFS